MDVLVTILVVVVAVLGLGAAVLLIVNAVRSMRSPAYVHSSAAEPSGEFVGLAAEEDSEEDIPEDERLAIAARAIARESGRATAEAFLREEGRLSAEEARLILGGPEPTE